MELKGTGLTQTFISNVIKKGTSDFKHNGSIYKMFWKWKSSGDKPVGRGQQAELSLAETAETAKAALKECSSDSSTFKLKHMQKVYKFKSVTRQSKRVSILCLLNVLSPIRQRRQR